MANMTKSVILTGLRANNDLTLGNYLGALQPLVDMAKQQAGAYQINLFVPDLHSFTTPVDHQELFEQIAHNLHVFAAAGLPLDHPDVYLYRQSYIPAHSELTWILDCFTGFGEMSRMTQFKDKSAKLTAERVTVSLYNYPVLMAADILLYNASYIPVGDDQTQHLEFTRNIAERFNSRFGNIFIVPETVKKQHEFFGKDQGLRIRDLIDPTKKMSKSDESGRGVIFLTDTPAVARKKIMAATTDSHNVIQFDMERRPGVSNLLTILALLRKQSVASVMEEYQSQTLYGPLKTAVADAVEAFLINFQSTLKTIDDKQLLNKIEQSEHTMREQANSVLFKVQQAVGLRSHS
ncbi:MAG: tryptophan--tRNA ligase [Candidatus Saccharimonadales bacterium]